jgi:hypothetical protein
MLESFVLTLAVYLVLLGAAQVVRFGNHSSRHT